MNKYFIIIALLFSFCTSAREPNIKIELENKNNKLRMYLINYDGGDVLINKRFSFVHYPSAHAPEIEFEIVNSKGKKFSFGGVLINDAEYLEESIIKLKFMDIIGTEFTNFELITFHHLEPGEYKVRVKYENSYGADKGVYTGRLISNWVTYKVPEKKEDIIRP
jgi:hypothetical protein